jgi:hypothetical protein
MGNINPNMATINPSELLDVDYGEEVLEDNSDEE